MKKIMNSICNKFSFLFLCLLAGVSAYAQDSAQNSIDTLSSSSYHIEMPKHLDPFYNGPLRFIIMGVAIALILYVSYRYWDANRMGKDIWHDPQ
jgi:hypothetical protein